MDSTINMCKKKKNEGILGMMIHSFLLIGQSNAAGRGFMDTAAPLDNCGGKIKMLRNGR